MTDGLINHTIKPRLSQDVRDLAERYLSGEFLRDIRPADFAVGEEGAGLSDNRRYALAIKMIAERAPLRLVQGERIVGSATLREALEHRTPACPYPSTSHTTIGFGPVLDGGCRGLREKLRQRLEDASLDAARRELLECMVTCLDAIGVWTKRHVAALEEAGGEQFRAAADCLRHVPENPPRSFREAVQSLWTLFCFQRLCGNWSGLGRLDEMLGPYLRRDLGAGTITLDEARDLLGCFWIKGVEWKGAGGGGSGDAQFYQNVILGGVDRHGVEVANEVTYLVLDVVEETKISDFPVAVRVNAQTPERLWRRIAEAQKIGGGIVAIYNEEVAIRALVRFGYELGEARQFSNDGCWELIIQGKTAFSYIPFDMLAILQETLRQASFETFEELYAAFLAKLREFRDQQNFAAAQRFKGDAAPTPLLSMFVEGCVERARAYNDRGPKYSAVAMHAGGVPDTANSLRAIKKLVFEERLLTLPALLGILAKNWEGHEELRARTAETLELYGNDNDEADAFAKMVYDDYVAIAAETREVDGVLRPAGLSTFGRELAYAASRGATAFGKRAGELLATNFAPTPGTDRRGATAVVKSFCKVDFTRLPNGCPLELKLLPSDVKGEDGTAALVGLLKTFVQLGGIYLQIDVVDNRTLRDAQLHPELHQNLSVRISGWSSRFVTLDKRWQDLVINRTQQGL